MYAMMVARSPLVDRGEEEVNFPPDAEVVVAFVPIKEGLYVVSAYIEAASTILEWPEGTPRVVSALLRISSLDDFRGYTQDAVSELFSCFPSVTPPSMV